MWYFVPLQETGAPQSYVASVQSHDVMEHNVRNNQEVTLCV